MAGRGVHFALSPEQEARLLAAVGDDEVKEVLHAIEEDLDTLCADTDKSWDGLHRCLSNDGILDPDSGEYPLSHAVLGGRRLLGDDAYYWACYVTASQVKDVAKALKKVQESRLRKRFHQLDPEDYDGSWDDDDFAYTWSGLLSVRELFAVAAGAGHAVVFTADQ